MSGKLNRAIELFVGRGTSPFPIQDEARVIAEFGADEGRVLAAEVRALLGEIDSFEPDWTKQNLVGATN